MGNSQPTRTGHRYRVSSQEDYKFEPEPTKKKEYVKQKYIQKRFIVFYDYNQVTLGEFDATKIESVVKTPENMTTILVSLPEFTVSYRDGRTFRINAAAYKYVYHDIPVEDDDAVNENVITPSAPPPPSPEEPKETVEGVPDN